jgi:hypothetical protein
MNRSPRVTSRAVPTAVLSAVALLVAVLVAPPTAGATGGGTGHRSGPAMAHRHAHAMTASQVPFYDAMRKLWEDHVTWTRLAMRTHLDQTPTEAADELGGDYAASVATYDAIHSHILAMADTLSAGIIAQFPRRFR